jgi:pimeloyl-ACP methyl ester carboxylesterase
MTLRTHLDGAIFAEHVSGRAPTILALHGWGRDRRDLLAALDGREVVSLDLPGFGASPSPDQPWGAARYAAEVARLLRQAGIGPVLVVGHSFGGRVAAHLAADHPDLVSGVVFAGTPLLRSTSATVAPLAYRTVRRLRRMRLVPESVLDTMRRRYGSADYRAATGTMRDVLVTVVNEDYRDQLARIAGPVGFCWGADDTAARPEIARQAAELVPRCAALDIVDGVGHDVHRDAAHRLAAVIDQVAASSDAS